MIAKVCAQLFLCNFYNGVIVVAQPAIQDTLGLEELPARLAQLQLLSDGGILSPAGRLYHRRRWK